MTEEQKYQVRVLRQQGLGYQAIGKMTNLTRDAVRSYCRNNGLNGVHVVVQMNARERIKNGEACAYCAGPLKKPHTGRPPRFCSNDCRRAYWKKHRSEGKRSAEAIYTMECKYCHGVFQSYGNKHRKYCCHEHYVLDRFGDYGREHVDANSRVENA